MKTLRESISARSRLAALEGGRSTEFWCISDSACSHLTPGLPLKHRGPLTPPQHNYM